MGHQSLLSESTDTQQRKRASPNQHCWYTVAGPNPGRGSPVWHPFYAVGLRTGLDHPEGYTEEDAQAASSSE